jgi:hypothetical protein
MKWVFCHGEKNIQSEVNDEEEDKRIQKFIENYEFLCLKGGNTTVFVNLHNIPWIVRQEVVPEVEEITPEIV